MYIKIADVGRIDLWLDDAAGHAYHEQPLAQDWARVGKIGEELGEAINELILLTGQNPRKGYAGSKDKLLEELADVVITGVFAIQHFTKDVIETRRIIEEKSDAISARMIATQESNK